jgi:uncharacterized repeat protein (TIGR02543 family)
MMKNKSAFLVLAICLVFAFALTACAWPEFTVSFDTGEGGSEVASLTASSIEAAPAEPTKANHKFIGWFDNAQKTGEPVTFPYLVVRNQTLYAKFLPYHLVTFVHVGIPTSVSITFPGLSDISRVLNGDPVQRPSTAPSAIGYRFVNYYADAELTKLYDFETPITEPSNVYCSWAIRTYTVTFNIVGEEDPVEVTAFHGANAADLELPYKRFYYLDFDHGLLNNITENHTINNAEWALYQNIVTITGGKVGGRDYIAFNNDDDDFEFVLTPDAFPADKYFIGWQIGSTPFDTFTTADLSHGDTIEVVLGNNFTIKISGATETLIYFNPTTTLKFTLTPTVPAGQHFMYWLVNGSTTITNINNLFDVKDYAANVTIAAFFGYRVNFAPGAPGVTNLPPVQFVIGNDSTSAIEPAPPQRQDYTFAGWTLNGSPFPSFAVPIQNDMTLTAEWEVYKFKVVFMDGVTQIGPDLVLDFGSVVAEPVVPYKANNKFLGWYLEGTFVTKFEDFGKTNAELTPSLVTNNATLTLYARYTANYTLAIRHEGFVRDIQVDYAETSWSVVQDLINTQLGLLSADASAGSPFIFEFFIGNYNASNFNNRPQATNLNQQLDTVTIPLNFTRVSRGLAFTPVTIGTTEGYSVKVGSATGTEIVIPSENNGKPVLEIGGSGFGSIPNLVISVPSSVRRIADYAFIGSTNAQITLHGAVPSNIEFGLQAFGTHPAMGNLLIFVPSASYDTFRNMHSDLGYAFREI